VHDVATWPRIQGARSEGNAALLQIFYSRSLSSYNRNASQKPDSINYRFPPEVDELIGEQIATGRSSSEAELLRDALRALAEDEQDLALVREAIADFEAGDRGCR
jgi:putative addiction module CopG family antidote